MADFALFTINISSAVNQSGIGCHVDGTSCNIIFYADDMVILAPSWERLQRLLNLAAQVVHAIDMKFNASKSIAMIFMPVNRTRRLTCIFDNFVLGNDNLLFVNSFKYLGHTLTDDLHDDDDMLKQTGLLYGRTNMLIRRFAKCSVPVKLQLFKAYCISFYGMALWRDYRKLTYLKIEAAYVKCIKMFFSYDRLFSVRQMFMELGLPTFSTLMHNAKLSFKNCCQVLKGNQLVSSVNDSCFNI